MWLSIFWERTMMKTADPNLKFPISVFTAEPAISTGCMAENLYIDET